MMMTTLPLLQMTSLLVLSLLLTDHGTLLCQALSSTASRNRRRRRRKTRSPAPPPPSLTSSPSPSLLSLKSELQKCHTVPDILNRVAPCVTPQIDPTGDVARLVLVRLSKLCLALDNAPVERQRPANEKWYTTIQTNRSVNVLRSLMNTLFHPFRKQNGTKEWLKDRPQKQSVVADSDMETLVEGTKASAILARLVPGFPLDPLFLFWNDATIVSSQFVGLMEPHHMTGLIWALETCRFVSQNEKHQIDSASSTISADIPDILQEAWSEHKIPFRIIPGGLETTMASQLSVEDLQTEVNFHIDHIKTHHQERVLERRHTAWQGDPHVAPFAYGGKSMPTAPWSPTVHQIRSILAKPDNLGQYFDGCLLNLYPTPRSGMRYHIDPDQGTLWDYDTAVVSVGSSRRFSFRPIPGALQPFGTNRMAKSSQLSGAPHNFVVMHGDVTHMFGRCQELYQHTVKKATDIVPENGETNTSPRISLVFKRSWGFYNH